MDLMERVKAECTSCGDDCKECRLKDKYGRCNITKLPPIKLDIEAIRTALGETSDKASDKEEIVVPDMWKEEKFEEMPFGEPYNMVHDVMRKQNAIIYCLERLKERLK